MSQPSTEVAASETTAESCNFFHEFKDDADSTTQACKPSSQLPSTETVQQASDVGMVWEIFSGSCRLSKACRNLGLEAFSVDKDPSRSEQAPVASFDLSLEEGMQALEDFATSTQSSLFHAHFAPSCGTASKARERKIAGVSNPPRPLRSEAEPDGISGLTSQEQARVEQANASYAGMARLIIFLTALNISVSVENPLNSLFWLTSAMRKVLNVLGAGHTTVLQHCMHGGDRDKSTKLWSYNPRSPNENLLASLGLMCDKQHTHKSWKPYTLNGKLCFPTKEEAAYPLLLCQRLASIFVQEATARGLTVRCDLEQQLQHDQNVGKRNLFTTQSRGNKLLPLVYPYGQKVEVVVSLHKDVLDGRIESFSKRCKNYATSSALGVSSGRLDKQGRSHQMCFGGR